MSLSHLLIHDTRANCPIHANYRTPLSFGALSKPAVSVLLSVQHFEMPDLSNLQNYNPAKQAGPLDVKVSVAVGALKVVPTAWMYDIIDIANAVVRNVVNDTAMIPRKTRKLEKEVLEGKRTMDWDRFFGPNVAFDLHVENPSIFILEDATKENTASFMISLAIAASAAVSPSRDIDTALSITDIRGCRSSPLDEHHPAPGMMDAITPFDINMNVHVRNNLQKIEGTLMTNHDLELRVGILDVRLFVNACDHLLPKDRRTLIRDVKAEEKREKKARTEKGERTEREVRVDNGLVADIAFKAIINSLSVTVVNDTKDYEIPVMQVVVGDVAGDVTRANGVLSVTTTMSLFAEYYNEALTVWEPVLEKWEVELTLVQEPRDRVVGDSSCHEL